MGDKGSNLLPGAKLRGRENFEEWKFEMKNVLVLDNTWYAVEGYPDDDKTDTVSRHRRNMKALAKINLSVEKNVFPIVMNAETAAEAWTALGSAYEDTGLSTCLRLLNQLCLIKLVNFTSMENYVNEILRLNQQLTAMKRPVDDDFLAMVMLKGLPDNYEPMIMALEHSGQKLTSDVVKTKLMQDDKYGNSDNVSNSKNAYFSSNRSRKKQPFCHVCKVIGHYKNDSCKPPNGQKYERTTNHVPENKKSNPQNDKGKGGYVNKKKALLSQEVDTAGQNKVIWYIDSGASSHMSGNRNIFTNFFEKRANSKVYIADNTELECAGSGDIEVELMTGESTTISNVTYVKNMTANLLSVNTMVKKGFTVIFKEDGCKIIDAKSLKFEGEIIASATNVGGLYVLDTKNHGTALMALGSDCHQLWHRRLAHLNHVSMKALLNMSTGASFLANDKFDKCVTCINAKQQRKSFKVSKSKLAANRLDLLHTDLCSFEHESWSRAKYMFTIIDDCTRKVFAYFLKSKDGVTAAFEGFRTMIENECDYKIKSVRSDNGKEYCNERFENLLKINGIKHQLTVPYNPEQNGVAERYNRTIVEKMRAMMIDAKCDNRMWAEAANTAVYLINRSPTSKLHGMTPEEKWSGTKPDLSHLRVFGCPAYAHIPVQKRKKLDVKSKLYTFVGYCELTKGYRLIDPETHKLVVACSVEFLEDVPVASAYRKHKNKAAHLRTLQRSDHSDHSDEDELSIIAQSDEEEEFEDETETDDEEQDDSSHWDAQSRTTSDDNATKCSTSEEDTDRRYPARNRKEKEFPDFVSYICFEGEPDSYQDAISGSNSKKWKDAMQSEIDSLLKNNTYVLLEKPKNCNIVKNKWVFKIKKGANGEILKYKARLVAKGCSQKFGVDYTETYSPVVSYSTLRFLFGLAVELNLQIQHYDVETAFLYGDLKEKIYMAQPEGFIKKGDENKVCLLKKSIYGLKQSSRNFHFKTKEIFLKLGFRQNQYESCIFSKINGDSIIIIALYVDDYIVFHNDFDECDKLKNNLKSHFDIKDLGSAKQILGMTIERSNGKLKIHHKQYILNLLTKFGMLDSKPIGTPLMPNLKLEKPNVVDQILPYQELIGSLMYLSVTCRPDIAYCASYLSQFNSAHDKTHWVAAKRVLRYLKGTMDYGLEYHKTKEPLKCFVDADWGNDVNDRKSFSGFIFKMSGAAIHWESRKQKVVSRSSTEAEYISLSDGSREAVFLYNFAKDLLSKMSICKILIPANGLKFFCDNNSAIALANNDLSNKRTKHIHIRYHYVKDQIVNGLINLNYLSTNEMLADFLTKSVSKEKHMFCCKGIGLN